MVPIAIAAWGTAIAMLMLANNANPIARVRITLKSSELSPG